MKTIELEHSREVFQRRLEDATTVHPDFARFRTKLFFEDRLNPGTYRVCCGEGIYLVLVPSITSLLMIGSLADIRTHQWTIDFAPSSTGGESITVQFLKQAKYKILIKIFISLVVAMNFLFAAALINIRPPFAEMLISVIIAAGINLSLWLSSKLWVIAKLRLFAGYNLKIEEMLLRAAR